MADDVPMVMPMVLGALSVTDTVLTRTGTGLRTPIITMAGYRP